MLRSDTSYILQIIITNASPCERFGDCMVFLMELDRPIIGLILRSKLVFLIYPLLEVCMA